MRIKIIAVCTIIFTLLIVSFHERTFAEPTPRQIVDNMDNREDGDTLTQDTLMVLINKNNQKRIRNIKNIRKDYNKDTKALIFFLSPADVRNTAYMSFDWDASAKEDDSWLYLPALQKVKRVASGDKSSAFMGSDFSYSDINGIEVEDWEYTFVKKNMKVDGADAWVVQGLPRKERFKKVLDETGYLKSLLWIRKDNHVLVKAKYWVKEGKKIKYFKAEDIRQVQGIWTPCTITMITTSKGKVEHSSVLKFTDIQYNREIKDSYFSTRSMERGL
ncbi:MAG: outer membrane lipoprotein-sorting protein [Desulfobacteraceae bacterium]|nr:outer membrane lipoprotein-sorting protein [Desulfobacteraceae bacterium]